MELLFNAYTGLNGFDNEVIRKDFATLYATLNGKDLTEINEIIDTVCTLCLDYEKVAFKEGVKVGIRLAKEIGMDDMQILSVYGNISCGGFKLIDDYAEGYLEIPSSMLGGADYFVLKATGQSMVEAGIDDGDLLIVQRKTAPDDGEIAVVLDDDRVVLKRFFRLETEGKYLLKPENAAYKPMVVDSCEVLGVAVKVIKNI